MPLKTFDDLLELTKQIKNKKLRQKVIEALKNPKFDAYPDEPVDLKDCPGAPWHHAYRGGLIDHTYAVTVLSLEIAHTLSKIYDEKINQDYLVAACLLHDIMKIYDYAYVEGKNKVVVVDETIRHAEMGAQFLSQKGFPEEVCRLVEQHIPWLGEDVLDDSIELQILLAADKLDSMLQFSSTLLFDNYISSSNS